MSRQFNTSGAYLSMGDTAALDLTGFDITVSAWIRATAAISAVSGVIGKYNATNQRSYMLEVGSDAKGRFITSSTGADFVIAQGATVLSTNTWYHLLGRQDSNDIDFFLNGTLDGTDPNPLSLFSNNEGATIGARASGANPFSALIAECAIWNIRLSDFEIAAIKGGLNPLHVRYDNLRGYWPIWGASSPEVDYSQHRSHATLNGTLAAQRHPQTSSFFFSDLPQSYKVIENVDAASIYVDIQIASEEGGPYSDAAEVYVDLQTSGVEEYVGSQIYTDSATVLVDLQSSGTEEHTTFDSATVYINLQALGGECFSTFSSENFGEGEANLRWTPTSNLRWNADEDLRWSASVSVGDTIHC